MQTQPWDDCQKGKEQAVIEEAPLECGESYAAFPALQHKK